MMVTRTPRVQKAQDRSPTGLSWGNPDTDKNEGGQNIDAYGRREKHKGKARQSRAAD
ncbi:MAG: hypothetical protein OES26_20410 [Gammaproteobacteria bacterium]|nr:hypothetical protein [Gammaproteobacteria bacterium]